MAESDALYLDLLVFGTHSARQVFSMFLYFFYYNKPGLWDSLCQIVLVVALLCAVLVVCATRPQSMTFMWLVDLPHPI